MLDRASLDLVALSLEYPDAFVRTVLDRARPDGSALGAALGGAVAALLSYLRLAPAHEPEERYTALFDLSLFSFLERRAELLEAAAGVKGPEATVWLLERLEKGPAPEKLACLRLLALAGTREAVRPIAAYLDHENHTLKTEAINALRSIVDGRPPFKHISVFDMIRLRQEWQGRLPGLLKEK